MTIIVVKAPFLPGHYNRSKQAKWFMEPFFEELIVGCFVRFGIGLKDGQSIYRLCMVQNVDASAGNASISPFRSYSL